LRFHIRVFKVRVVEPPTLPQVSPQVTVRHIFNKDKKWIYGNMEKKQKLKRKKILANTEKLSKGDVEKQMQWKLL